MLARICAKSSFSAAVLIESALMRKCSANNTKATAMARNKRVRDVYCEAFILSLLFCFFFVFEKMSTGGQYNALPLSGESVAFVQKCLQHLANAQGDEINGIKSRIQ
jgi:hypothetical protein